ncbi:LysR family transcriptional regulator [Tannockella kyphosi]|uniref:LysR family transcriptional regulator n=1 Tax=Tannockella kyphosi TaxID=2899121 RepID=UPI00201197EA|nr:LysR family transcriptional regulator [Tannockella kyphosi]
MAIKLEQYKIFNEAAATLSFSIAAKNLFISQSAVSQTILNLEKELDTQLFIRQSNGVTLTNEGKLLQKQIENAMHIITNVENQLANIKTLTGGELRIGAGDTLSKYYVLKHLTLFHELYPAVTIKVLNRTSSETIALLKSGQIDLAFVNLPIQEEGVHIEPCFKVHDIFVSNKLINTPMSLKQLSKESLIMLETSSSSRRYIDTITSKQGILLSPSIELGSHDLLLDFTHAGLGIACVIEEFSKEAIQNKLVYPIPLEKPIASRSIGYAFLQRRTLPPACLKFIELLS